MFPAQIIESVLSGVLGMRRKRSRRALRFLTGRGGGLFSNPQTLLTAAGLAWGIFETLQIPGVGGQAPASESSTPPPIPGAPAPAAPPATPVADGAVRLVRLAISAAYADGAVNDHERAAVMLQAVKAGAGELVERELQSPRPLSEIVAGVTDPADAATLYVLAFTILRADEQVTGAERIYLAQLANLLHLEPESVTALEKDTGERIDALGDQGQPGG